MLPQLAIALRLHFRNRLAILYSYLFPTLFLIAFWVLYRYEPVPLIRHLGELLTVTALGGACFGLPTTMVSERERGVWRRYRLTPVPAASLVASTLVARYVLLLIAATLQVGLAMALGMPLPRHPLDLLLAFTAVAFAFLGLGLVIAMLANTVPAVQALGQCLFLPLLIIGGVAVPLARLPPWAQQVAAFFPGRYAVEAIQATATGPGLEAARFSVLALLIIGGAACVAGARLFRWDAQHGLPPRRYAWVAVALTAWVAVGLVAHARGRARPRAPAVAAETQTAPAPQLQPAPAAPVVKEEIPPRPVPVPNAAVPDRGDPPAAAAPAPKPAPPPSAEPPRAEPAPVEPTTPPSRAVLVVPPSWRGVTMEHIERDLRFDRLPGDEGVVAPIAPPQEEPDTDVANQPDYIAGALHQWAPAQVGDPVQRVRNVLFVAAVPDVFQMDPLERFLPLVVFDHLKQTVPSEDLVKILYWIALHPTHGDDTAVDDLRALRLGNGPADMEQTRERAALYAVKLLGRLTGKLK